MTYTNRTLFEDLFARNGWSPLPDAELVTLLVPVKNVMGAKALRAYISRVYITDDNQPVYQMRSLPGEQLMDMSYSGVPIYWYNLRKDLAVIPAYFSAATSAGLDKTQANELLLKLASGAKKYAMLGLTSKIENLTDVLQQTGFASPTATYTELSKLITEANKDGSIGRALGITKLGLHAGMSLEQTLDIVHTIYDRSSLAEYVFMALYDELNAMASNTAGGDALHAALKRIMGDNPYFQADFAGLTRLAHLAVTQTQYSLGEVFHRVATIATPKLLAPDKEPEEDSEDTSVLSRAATVFLPDQGAQGANKSPADYFPFLNKRQLVHGVFPYRMHRSFEDGLSDLERLMKTEHTEGGFVFDPEKGIWYSLGGRTELGYGRVRHECFPYDLSRLSTTPVFVHIHPRETECFVSPDRDNLAYPQLQDKLTKLFSAIPSTADWKMMATFMKDTSRDITLRSLIVTSTGVTEMHFPQDASRIETFTETYSEKRDGVLLNFHAGLYLRRHGVNKDYAGFVQTMLPLINNTMPSDFRIDQYPLGHFLQSKLDDELDCVPF